MSNVDLIVIGVVLFIFTVGMIFANIIFTNVNEMFPAEYRTESFNHTFDVGEKTLASFDYLSILLFVGLVSGSVISAFFLRTHPVFFIFSAMILIISLIFIGPGLANAFVEFASADAVSPYSGGFSVTEAFWTNAGLIFTVIGIIIIIATYAKREDLI